MDLAQRFGVKHIMLSEKDGRIPTEDVLAAIGPRTRMVALSHVEYGSGYRNDLAAIGKVCRERGVLLCVDAIQSCGVVPVDVQAMNIDFLSADGHKWLLGPEGLGFFYCRKELITKMRPEIGWMNVINATDYGDYDFTLRSDAKRFECGSYNLPGIMALGASLELFFEVGLDLVFKRIEALCEQLAAGLEKKGYAIFSPRTKAAGETHDPRSGIVTFTHPRGNHNKIAADLEAKKIIVVVRAGRLRASPHFYNTPEQMNRLLEALPTV
jgi:selenocysteine lyase/cysteine desulfurase